MHLTLDSELARQPFAEIGKPYRMFRDPGGRFIAICSEFPYICWSGRLAYNSQGPRHRVNLYRPGSYERFATLDCSYPVNDLSAHPERPEIAIASGSYDGGFFFEGELLLWNWETGDSHPLVCREAVRCRFDSDNSLTVLLRPEDEEQYEGPDPWETFVGLTLDDLRPGHPKCNRDLEHLQPTDPALWGFEVQPESHPPSLSLPDLEELSVRGFQERRLIWDILWLDDRTFAAVHQNCHVEIHDIIERRCVAAFYGEGHGVELLPRAGNGFLVHVLLRSKGGSNHDKSSLHVWDGNTLSLFRHFDHAYSFSIDRAGNILARGTDYAARRDGKGHDQILDHQGLTILETDLGAFDCYNHHIRLSGGTALYHLRGTPAGSHEHKKLCSITPDGSVHELFTWEEAEFHLLSSVAAFVTDQEIIRGCQAYHPVKDPRDARIERLTLEDGKSSWLTPMKGSITALAISNELGIAAFSKTDGMLGLISLKTGEILFEQRLSFEGVSVIATALAMRGGMLLVGTLDGRLLNYRVVRQLQRTHPVLIPTR